MTQPFETSTAQWTLVVLRVSQTTARVWVGTLFPTLKKPEHAKVELKAPDGTTQVKKLVRTDWRRPFRDMRQRFFALVDFTDLQPETHYQVRFLRRIEKSVQLERPEQWQELRDGQLDTLPDAIPASGNRPFTIGLGSCFYSHRDGGQAAGAYRALYERGPKEVRPDVTFLTGDQVYLDIGFDSLSLLRHEIRQRIADDYAQHWQLLGSIFSRGGTWMLPDDHEYWNDFPFYDSLIPTLLALKFEYVRKSWTRSSLDGVRRVQSCPRVETFTIGSDLSVCLADFRSYRSENGFMPDKDLNRVIRWAEKLDSPGVLAIPQPLLVEENITERNLVRFKDQYTKLLIALGSTGHDIVVLSGDVHFGRISSATLGPKGGRLIEVISSPLSNLTGLNGIATASPKFSPKKFPDPDQIKIPDWTPTTVHHDKSFAVSTKKGHPFSAYPRRRTREHFMTVSFQRHAQDKIKIMVNAWRIRERDSNNLPVRDFETYETLIS